MTSAKPTERRCASGADDGSILVALVVTLGMFAILASAVVSLMTTSTYEHLLANSSHRAFLLAKSGLALYPDSTPDAVTVFTLADGETISIDRTTTLPLVTGKVDVGTPFQAVRTYTIDLISDIIDDFEDIQFDSDGDGGLDDTWTTLEGEASIKSTGPTDGEQAVVTKGEEVSMGISWQDKPWLDLEAVWNANGNLLSYEMQVKLKVLPTGNSGKHYMVGLSFRLREDTDSLYGVSFFRSLTNDSPPTWLSQAVGFDSSGSDIIDDSVHLVLWKRINGGPVTLIDYKTMGVGDGVLDGTELKAWSTILLRVEEDFSGPGGTRQNHISAFVQGTDAYPRNGAIDWTHSTFNSVTWNDDGDTTVTDASITTDGFESRPSEMGVHTFYDSSGSNQQMMDDFGLNLLP